MADETAVASRAIPALVRDGEGQREARERRHRAFWDVVVLAGRIRRQDAGDPLLRAR